MSNLVPLSEIFSRHSSRQGAAFLRDGKALSWSDFERDVHHFSGQLAQHNLSKWLLYCDDAYWFAVGLMALACAQKEIILPPNMQPDSLREMTDDREGILTDRRDGAIDFPHILLERTAGSDGRAVGLVVPVPGDVPLTLKTSGSTGAPKHIAKTLGALEREVYKLDEKWRLSDEKGVVVSTVSHFHIYGMLYQILWPLMAGVTIWARRVDYPEQLAAVTTHGDLSLVSSPAFLTRWEGALAERADAAEVGKDLATLADHMVRIFSSGGKLPDRPGTRLSRILDSPIFEIYGSTETGGVAIRQAGQEEYLTVLPGVTLRVAADGLLSVHSDHTGTSDWIPMGDRVRLCGADRFVMLGRADRIEKVEEKRVSLTEMEQRLTALDDVRDVRLVVLRGEGRRDVIAAVVVLSGAGDDLLAALGKRDFVAKLRGILSGYYEAILLPRKWRFVPDLPYTAQGKIELAALSAMFATESEPRGMSQEKDYLPCCDVVALQEDTVVLNISAPAGLLCFDGHFDGLPVVPGVVQLDWAFIFARKYFRLERAFGGAEVLKYMSIIQADDQILLSLRYETENEKIYFTYAREDKICSSGRILLGGLI